MDLELLGVEVGQSACKSSPEVSMSGQYECGRGDCGCRVEVARCRWRCKLNLSTGACGSVVVGSIVALHLPREWAGCNLRALGSGDDRPRGQCQRLVSRRGA